MSNIENIRNINNENIESIEFWIARLREAFSIKYAKEIQTYSPPEHIADGMTFRLLLGLIESLLEELKDQIDSMARLEKSMSELIGGNNDSNN